MSHQVFEVFPEQVALLAEGVDRNQIFAYARNGSEVALLAEGVDRNNINLTIKEERALSPSSRRAWIEICSIG